jgi:hypothetical protein
MVDFFHDTENQRCVCKTDKLKSEITIEKELGGYRFFIITFSSGKVPAELSGRYSSIPEAQKAVEQYLRNKSKSSTIKRDEYAEDFMKRKKVRDAAKSKPKSS